MNCALPHWEQSLLGSPTIMSLHGIRLWSVYRPPHFTVFIVSISYWESVKHGIRNNRITFNWLEMKTEPTPLATHQLDHTVTCEKNLPSSSSFLNFIWYSLTFSGNPKLPADNRSVSCVSAVIADSAPLSSDADLHSTFTFIPSSSQSDVRVIAGRAYKAHRQIKNT